MSRNALVDVAGLEGRESLETCAPVARGRRCARRHARVRYPVGNGARPRTAIASGCGARHAAFSALEPSNVHQSIPTHDQAARRAPAAISPRQFGGRPWPATSACSSPPNFAAAIPIIVLGLWQKTYFTFCTTFDIHSLTPPFGKVSAGSALSPLVSAPSHGVLPPSTASRDFFLPFAKAVFRP